MDIHSIKKSLIAVFAIICINSGILFGSESNKKVIDELTVKYQQEFQAQVADKEINDLAQGILKKCGITRPVIILQNKKLSNCYSVAEPSKHPQEFMIVGTADKGILGHGNVKPQKSVDSITAHVYHETGHIANGDCSRRAQIEQIIGRRGTLLVSLFSGCAAAYKGFEYSSSIGVAAFAGVSATVATLATGYHALMYKSEYQERCADKFMYNQMIKHGKIASVVTEIHSRLAQGDDLSKKSTGYPANSTRARIGIDCLQENGIKVKDLMQNLPEDLDEKLKKDFCKQIEHHYTALLKKEK